MRRSLTLACVLAGLSLAPSLALAQTVSAPASPVVPRVGARVGTPPAEYDDGGRRDPFVSVITPKSAPVAGTVARSRPAAGLAGVSIADVQVKGLIKSGATLIALLQGPDGRTYMAKRQDRLQDGSVSRIDSDAVVFTERVADAAGVVRARDVRKPLRAAVSGGQ